MRSIIANLTPASGRQDHTTSPSAKAFRKSRSAVLVPLPPKLWRRPINAARLASPSRPPHPVPTSVTIAKRPSQWDGIAGNMEVICGKREAKYFFGKDWTGSISLIRFDKFAVRRKGSTPSARRSSLRRHCERSEAIHFAAQSEIGLLPPSLFELRRTRSALRSLAQTHRVCRRQ